MNISLIYFTESIDDRRKHHSVSQNMLKMWQYFFRKSGTQLKPVLLTDKQTQVPTFWEHDVMVVKDSEPPDRLDVLHKVGWLKMQACDLLGKTLVMDLDALVVRPIDELADISGPIAMSPYPTVSNTESWPFKRLNAGTMILNSPEIAERFKKIWQERKKRFLFKTYFDELIFTALHTELNGYVLADCYQAEWEAGNDQSLDAAFRNENNKVLHFCGASRKQQLNNFYLSHIKL